VLRAALGRAGVTTHPDWSEVLVRPGQAPVVVDEGERPPIGGLPEYRRRR
jgi:hypothetical protein